MNMINRLLITTLVFAMGSGKVFAAPPRIPDLGGILDNVFSYLLPIGGLLATGMLIMGGYMWLTSSGDSGKVAQAQGTITWAILGLVFLTIFGLVLRAVFDFLGN